MATDVEKSLRDLQDRIDALAQSRQRAQARAEIAQTTIDEGLQELKRTLGVESVAHAQVKIAQVQAKIDESLKSLVAEVEELERG